MVVARRAGKDKRQRQWRRPMIGWPGNGSPGN
jgi:hypothetical protein